MNGIETIVMRITETAQAEAAAVLADAERRCQQITADCEQQAQAAYRARIQAGVQEHELRVQRLRKGNAMHEKQRLLTVRQDLISEAFARAAELLDAMAPEEYVSFLAYLANNAAETGTETVLFNERDRDAIGNRVVEEANRIRSARGEVGALVLDAEHRAIRGGLILKRGPVEINCSVEKMMAQRRNELSAPVAAVLFDAR